MKWFGGKKLECEIQRGNLSSVTPKVPFFASVVPPPDHYRNVSHLFPGCTLDQDLEGSIVLFLWYRRSCYWKDSNYVLAACS